MALTVVVFAAATFVAIGFTIATSTTGSSSLEETRSFTIPTHTTDIIRTTTITHTVIILIVTIPMATAMDTVALAVVAFATVISTGVAFTAVVFTAIALIMVALTAVPRTGVDDERVYQGISWLGRYSRFVDDCHFRSRGFVERRFPLCFGGAEHRLLYC